MVYIPTHAGSEFRLRRSALFMPSSNERALVKAKSLDCDCLIFDLEDAVADEMRGIAHTNLLKLVKGEDFGSRERIIRTTAIDAASFEADLKVALSCKPDAILLPKVSTATDITQAARLIDNDIKIWAMIETPLALMNLKEICIASDQLACLVVGPNDLAKETGTKMDRALMHPWLMMAIAAARAYDLSVLDGVYNNFKDLDGFSAECRQGAEMGFDGKTLIHPSQIVGANDAFGPQEAELQRAKQIVEAFEQPESANKGAIQISGEMIERLHLAQAKKLLQLFDS